MKYSTEMTLKVFDDNYGFCVIVKDDDDGLDHIEIMYSEDGSYSSETPRISIHPDMAEQVAGAIYRLAAHVRARDNAQIKD